MQAPYIFIKEDDMSALTKQIGGTHYTRFGAYQPWEVLHKWLTPEEFKGAIKKDAITYLMREKGGREDFEKALHTIQIYLELTKEEKQ